MRRWRAANRERDLQSTRASVARWREKDPEAARDYRREHYRRHSEKVAAKQREHRAANADAVRAQERARYEADPSMKRASVRRWSQENPEAVNERSGRRRAAKLQASPPWLTAELKAEMRALYLKARRLTALTGIEHHVDHEHPLQGKRSCGLHVPWNLQILTAAENIRKRIQEGLWRA